MLDDISDDDTCNPVWPVGVVEKPVGIKTMGSAVLLATIALILSGDAFVIRPSASSTAPFRYSRTCTPPVSPAHLLSAEARQRRRHCWSLSLAASSAGEGEAGYSALIDEMLKVSRSLSARIKSSQTKICFSKSISLKIIGGM
jgi:hypothetical protein